MYPSKYSIELWTPNGVQLADLGGRAMQRRLTITRNEAEDIQWRLDWNEFRRYCEAINTYPELLLQEGITEVRIKRGETYLCGGQVTYIQKDRSAAGDFLDIRATGFLNLFADRYTANSVIYNENRSQIAVDLINTTQGQGTNWNFGVTIGHVDTVGLYYVEYQNARIKDALQDLSKLQLGFDFRFTHDKVFQLYATLGTQRPDILFEYPGNVTRLTETGDATNIQNRLAIYGAGNGQAAKQIDMSELNSQLNYKVHEKLVQLSGVLDDGTLEDYGNSIFAAWGRPFKIPAIEYIANGVNAPLITDYSIGDYVKVYETDNPFAILKGMFRIEQIDLTLDEEDTETVKLSLGI
jgi:hypothetical protein